MLSRFRDFVISCFRDFVPPARFERAARPLEGDCSSTELRGPGTDGTARLQLHPPARFERATCGFEGRRSVQLSYGGRELGAGS